MQRRYALKLIALTAGACSCGWAAGALPFRGKAQLNTDALQQTSVHQTSVQKANAQPNVQQSYIAKLKQAGFVPNHTEENVFLKFHKRTMFTTSVLTGNNRLTELCQLRNPQTGEIVTVFRVGSELSTRAAFPLAMSTLFDQFLAQAAFENLPNKLGVTGTLKLGEVTAVPKAGECIALHAVPTEHKGRKSLAEGSCYLVSSGKKIATGRVVMIEPFWAKYAALLI